MTDITITRNSELMIAQVDGETDEGVDFVDAWLPESQDAEYSVVDLGRILVHERELPALVKKATENGLTTETIEQ